MLVGTLELELRMDGCFSLKDKRRILRSLVDRVRRDFHVAIAEVGDLDLWNSAVLGVSCVSNNAAHAESILTHVVEAADQNPDIVVASAIKEVIRT